MRRGETSTLRSGAAALEKALSLEQLVHEPRRPGGVLELADHRLADLVRQLLAADLDEEGAHAPRSGRRGGFAAGALATVAEHLEVEAGDLAREVAHAPDVHRAVGDADRAAGIEHVEGVAALEHLIVGGHRQTRLETALGLVLVLAEVPVEHVGVGDLEAVAAELALVLAIDVPVGDGHRLTVFVPLRPHEVVDAVHALQVHGQALQPVGELDGDGVEVEAAQLLEVRELGGFHAVDPDLPALPPGAQGRALPVVLDEAHVVLGQVDAQRHERLQVHVLDVGRRRLDDDLVLVVVTEAIRVLAVATVGGAHGRLDVGRAPRARVEAAQKGRRVERAGPDLRVIRLHDDAALLFPVGLQPGDDLLERGKTSRASAPPVVVVHCSSASGAPILAGPPSTGQRRCGCHGGGMDKCSIATVVKSRVHVLDGRCASTVREGRRDGDANTRRRVRRRRERRARLSGSGRRRRSARGAREAQSAQARPGVVAVQVVDVAQRLGDGRRRLGCAELGQRPSHAPRAAPRSPRA